MYHFISFNSEQKLQIFAEEMNKIFEIGHISHKKIIIHAMNIIEDWFENDTNSNSKGSEKKKFLTNYENFKKLLNPKSLINAFDR